LGTGLLQVFSAWNIRNKFYKSVSISRVTQSSTTAISQFIFRLYIIVKRGLVLGHIVGLFISLSVLIFYSIKKNTIHLKKISSERIVLNLKEYKNFPKYQSFSVLINSFSQHLPVILLTIFYSPVIAGFYSLTHRALNTPARLIGGSVRQVFYENASKIYSSGNSIKNIYEKVTLNLIKVTIIPYIIIGLTARYLFPIIFGTEWLISGIYAQFVIIFIFTITVNPPSVMSIQILGMQKFHLKYEILLAIFRFIAIFIGYHFFDNHFVSIGLFAAVGLIFNVFLISYVYHRIKLDTNYI
jgi:O-antigen/teichoic acid export membrane protein